MRYVTYKHIVLAAKIYLAAIGVFTVFRLILFFTGLSFITPDDSFGNILYAFWMGLRFDTVITGYIVFFPFLALIVIAMINPRSKLPGMIIFYFLFAVFSLSFAVCAIDIPFFGQFFVRLNMSAFQWLESPLFVAKMVLHEFRFIGYMIPLTLLLIIFFWVLKRSFSDFFCNQHQGNILLTVLLSLCVSGLMFTGMRGRLEEKTPIVVGTAFFGQNAFLNQLGLNPNFTLMRSFLDNKSDENKTVHMVHFMDNDQALQQVQSLFSIESPDDCSPILRRITPDTVNTNPANVVFVLMESMSAARMTYFGSQKQLTPFLDSIASKSYFFENFYGAGAHTHNGIFSTLFSYPTIYRQRIMDDVTMPKFNNMASVLKKNGYSAIYFTTHDGQFDNIEGFLTGNSFDKVIKQTDYPSNKVVSNLGVPDDYMFEFSIPVLNKLYAQKRPFFATFSTSSNHSPYYIPGCFSPRQQNIRDAIVEYADWALYKFIQMAEQQDWFDNTIFIFVADHGGVFDDIYSMPLNYHHIPLIIHAPKIITQPQIFDCMGGQIDIFPTVMHLLQLPYINNTMGIDLLSEKRPFMYFSAHDKYGVVSDSLFLIVTKNSETDELFRYRQQDKTNYIDHYKTIADEMKNYAKANFQVTRYIISQRKQYCE